MLVDAAGNVTEGPGFNVFALVDGTLVTPAAGVLEGISRRTVIRAGACGIPVREAALPVAELKRADEVFLSTGGGVIGISRVDGVPVAGRASAFEPVTLLLQQAYWGLHEDSRYVETVDYS